MSDTQAWELIVPDDGEQLLAELNKRGVRPGQRIVVTIPREQGSPEPPLPKVFGIFDGPPDLAERSSEILEAEFPGDW